MTIDLGRATYDLYLRFFETAERRRRWSIFNDVPWEGLSHVCPSTEETLCVETFCGVEMYLPDYLAHGIAVARTSYGQAWFQANWGYEESKHSLVLREYLVRSGQRTTEQMMEFERAIFAREWLLPFRTWRQMTVYGAIQELATWLIYRKQMQDVKRRGNAVLGVIYQLIAADEAAHAGFYQDMLNLCVQENREGTLADLAVVSRGFRMPAYDLVPDYGSRVEVMRSVGIDRSLFLAEVWLPLLRRLRITREEVARASAVAHGDTMPSSPSSGENAT